VAVFTSLHHAISYWFSLPPEIRDFTYFSRMFRADLIDLSLKVEEIHGLAINLRPAGVEEDDELWASKPRVYSKSKKA
jgi:hypothetical protein